MLNIDLLPFLNISYAPPPFIESYIFKVVPFFEIRPALEVYKHNMHLHM